MMVWSSNLLDGEDTGRLVYLIVLLAVVASGVVFGTRSDIGRNLKYLMIWAGIFAVIAIIASFRPEMQQLGARVMGQVDPARGEQVGTALHLSKRDDGHYWVRAEVNGASALFIVDTGASSILITRDTAQAIGIDVSQLQFWVTTQTANGEARAAPVAIKSMKVGEIERQNLKALVGDDGLQVNLLGMTFLDTLGSVRMERGTLVLTP
jgi:aspartyl protease family protein